MNSVPKTLSELDPENHQQVVEFVFMRLLEQGKPAMHPYSAACFYRMQDQNNPTVTLKCAAGHLIDDKHYSESWENTVCSRESLVGQYIIRRGFNIGIVRALQSIHDSWTGDQFTLLREFQRLCDRLELDASRLQEIYDEFTQSS